MVVKRMCSGTNPACSADKSTWVFVGSDKVCPSHYHGRLVAENESLRRSFEMLQRISHPTVRRFARRAVKRCNQALGPQPLQAAL